MVGKGREIWPSRKLTCIQASGRIEQRFRCCTEIYDPPSSGGRVHLRGCPEFFYKKKKFKRRILKFFSKFDEENKNFPSHRSIVGDYAIADNWQENEQRHHPTRHFGNSNEVDSNLFARETARKWELSQANKVVRTK